MENKELVSVIIPVFNVKPYLKEALDSVIYQTYENLEIIIVDDGSTDGSGEICDEYAVKDKRIQVLHQENKGLSNARNVGLDMMTSKFVVFLDPDDAYDVSFIEKMMSAITREKVDLIVCKYTVQHTTGLLKCENKEKSAPSIEAGVYGRVSALQALTDGMINVSVWNKLYRRDLWKNIRFPEGHVYEDLDTMFKIFDICGEICVINHALYFHRKRPESITDTISMENINDRILACIHFETFVKEHIPEIFTSYHLNKRYRSRLIGMITTYIHYSNKTENENDFFREELRKQTIIIGKEIGIDMLGFRAKIAYYMLRLCPRLLNKIYPIYHFVRLFIWKNLGL